MNKYDIVKRIERFAPIDTAEKWDCVGFMVETSKVNVSKVMVCLTPTDSVVNQAISKNCDMIVAHHPAFFVPIFWSKIDIYSAHTNLDKAKGGTTDTIIDTLNLSEFKVDVNHEFLRFIDFGKKISIDNFSKKLLEISPNARLVNNINAKFIQKIAFCAGSGSEFVNDAKNLGADCFVTGDCKFHPALEYEIPVYDIGHFESEILIRPVLKKLVGDNVDIIFAEEYSPFISLA